MDKTFSVEEAQRVLVHFRELGSASNELSVRRLAEQAKEFWARVTAREFSASQTFLCFDSRLELCVRENDWVLRHVRLEARPLRDFVASHCPPGLRVQRGHPSQTHEEALRLTGEELGVELSTSRVRVGFTRGHLLDIVVLVPLDVAGNEERLQVAAETYLEHRLGDEALDTWVHSVGISRIARSRGLVLAADTHGSAASYPLAEVSTLLSRGIEGVLEGLTDSVFQQPNAAWTALQIPPSQNGFQAERCYASTNYPEALKSALEGMPFSSKRFTRGSEVLAWVRWQSSASPPERATLRMQAESLVQQRELQGRVLLAGSGFGARSDYLDVWIEPCGSLLKDLGARFSALCGETTLGFYDSHLRAEEIVFPGHESPGSVRGTE